jgi:hypothetical protein
MFLGDPREHAHVLDLLAEMSERYSVEMHARVLPENHYHLLIRRCRLPG